MGLPVYVRPDLFVQMFKTLVAMTSQERVAQDRARCAVVARASPPMRISGFGSLYTELANPVLGYFHDRTDLPKDVREMRAYEIKPSY